MRSEFHKLMRSTFVRNVLTLMSGTAISQAVLFLATPLLTRIFTPADFGIFALYTAITATIVTVASWKYELAIVLPEKDEDAIALTWLSVFGCLATTALLVLLILLFGDAIADQTNPEIKTFIWVIPAGVLISGMLQVFISLGTRHRRFTGVSVSRILQSSVAVGSQAGVQMLAKVPLGLIWGKIAGDLVSSLYLILLMIKRGFFSLKTIDIGRIRKNARIYRDFPLYQSSAAFLNSLSQNLPAIMLTALYDPVIAGYYALTSRVLGTPTTLVGRSTREVYYQKASEMYARGEGVARIFARTTMGLAKAGIGPFILIGIFAIWLFRVVFGAEWVVAGEYARIILLWSFLGFINAPATMTLYILGLQKFNLKYEMAMFVFRFISLYFSFVLFDDHYITIAAYASVGVIFNIFLIWYSYRKAKQHNNQLHETT